MAHTNAIAELHIDFAEGYITGSPGLLSSSRALAIRLSRDQKMGRLRPRQVANLCKMLLLPRLDWAFAVPTHPGTDFLSWKRQDEEADKIVVSALSGPVFSRSTTGPRKIPHEVILRELNIKPAYERRGGLARGLSSTMLRLPLLHPSRICAQNARLAANRANQPTDWLAR